MRHIRMIWYKRLHSYKRCKGPFIFSLVCFIGYTHCLRLPRARRPWCRFSSIVGTALFVVVTNMTLVCDSDSAKWHLIFHLWLFCHAYVFKCISPQLYYATRFPCSVTWRHHTGWPFCVVTTSSWLGSSTFGKSLAAAVAAYCPGRMAEHPKSKSTGGFNHAEWSPCN